MNNILEQKFTILGPSGVGKTTLMATMYDNVRSMFDGSLLSIKPTTECLNRINRSVTEMNCAISKDAEFTPVGGTSTPVEYAFEIGMGGSYYIRCSFKDFPGGWLSSSTERFNSEVLPWLNESNILLLPVDASLIMEYKKNSKTEKKAAYDLSEIVQLERIVGDWAKIRKSKKTIARMYIVPIRCETYMKDDNKRTELKYRIEEVYKAVIEALCKNTDQFQVFYCPVDTYGCVEFVRCTVPWPKNNDGSLRFEPTYRCTSVSEPKREPKGADEIFANMLGIFVGTQFNHAKNKFEDFKSENWGSLLISKVLPESWLPESIAAIVKEKNDYLGMLEKLENGKEFMQEVSTLLMKKTTGRLEIIPLPERPQQ